MTTENTIPPGYWKNARGDLVPESRVTDIDKLRDQVVRDMCLMAKERSTGLRDFKLGTMQEVAALVTTSMEQYGVKQGADDNIKALVTHAFQTDKEGKINTGRVLGLRQLKITDSDWLTAMQAITDSIKVASTKPYIRFYERNAQGGYDPINLDLAAV